MEKHKSSCHPFMVETCVSRFFLWLQKEINSPFCISFFLVLSGDRPMLSKQSTSSLLFDVRLSFSLYLNIPVRTHVNHESNPGIII